MHLGVMDHYNQPSIILYWPDLISLIKTHVLAQYISNKHATVDQLVHHIPSPNFVEWYASKTCCLVWSTHRSNISHNVWQVDEMPGQEEPPKFDGSYGRRFHGPSRAVLLPALAGQGGGYLPHKFKMGRDTDDGTGDRPGPCAGEGRALGGWEDWVVKRRHQGGGLHPSISEAQNLHKAIWAPSQYPKRRLFIRSRKVSKPRDWYFKLSYRFEIWQAHRQHCCRSACQISERSDNSKYKSRGFQTLRDLTKRRLFGYWDWAQVFCTHWMWSVRPSMRWATTWSIAVDITILKREDGTARHHKMPQNSSWSP